MEISLLALAIPQWVTFVGIGIAIFGIILFGILAIAFAMYGNIWFQAYMSRADVSLISLIGMGFRQ